MNKLSVILLSAVALASAGCGNQGGSSDTYKTESGTSWKTNYDRSRVTNDYQGGAWNSGRSNVGINYSTNYPGLGTNNPNLTIDPERTNNVPEK